MHAGIGAMEAILLIAMMFGGGTALSPLGVPLPPDVGLQSTAPEDCLIYLSYAGQGNAEPGSKNQVEQLHAEPEIQAFIAEVDRLVQEGLKHIPADDEKERTLARALPVIVRTLLLRPHIHYVADVAVPPQQPSGHAGIVVNAGDKSKAFVAALEELESLYLAEVPANQAVERSEVAGVTIRRLPTPPQVPPVAWGVKGDYVFLALGEGEAARIVQSLADQKGPPKWLAELEKELEIARPGALAYLNTAAVIKTAEPLFPLIGADAPPPLRDIGKLLDATGLRHLRHVAFSSGLGEEAAVTKVSIGHDGKAEGLLALAGGKPLTTDDFVKVPATAEFAGVGRFDPQRAYEVAMSVVERIDPDARVAAEKQLGEAQDQLGFSVEEELLAGLGDTWSIYNNCEEGGLLFTGLCLTVSVRDRPKLEKVIDQVLRLAEKESRGNRDEKMFAVRKTPAGERTIQYLQIAGPSPVAPAWCLDGDSLVIALSPQMVRAHLTRSADQKTLASLPLIQARLASGDVTSLTYQNTQLGLQAIYSYAQFLVTAGAGMMEKETGIQADLAKFPSLGSISRHMRPSVHVTRNTKTGILMETYATGPSLDVLSAPMIGMFFGTVAPAVAQARFAAQEAVAMNNMRQISLALLSYEAEHGRFPKNIVDADGNAILSWRVAILPYLDQAALYEEFHRDEPWNSAHNAKLLARMPPSFQHPSEKLEAGKTLYQLPTGAGTLFDAREVRLADLQNAGVRTTQAAMVLESSVADAVAWTKPSDVKLDLQSFVDKLFRDRQGFTSIARADGSVQRQSLADRKELEDVLFPR
ncbi:MAG: hypothetical protein C0483_19050 [Pirellula sp.]|nr:hypothetical protein [Pirellula sp.]